MDSTNLFRKTLILLEKLKEQDSDKVLLLDEVFKNLLLLKNKYKISFDLDSFTKISLKDIENINNFSKENDNNKDNVENSLKIKKNTKKLFNLSLLYLFQALQNEKYFEFSLDKLVELMEFEFEMGVEVKGVKNVEFFELFLNTLFYGNFYYKGLVQHFLLNSRYTFHLPFTLNNIIRNMEKNKKINEYLNNDRLVDYDTFYERFLIFVSKLKTPDTYDTSESNQDKILKISKKEFALKNTIEYLQNNNNYDRENSEDYYDEELSDDGYNDSDQGSDDYGNEDEHYSNKEDNDEFYNNNYVKLWENILNEVLYSVDSKNLTIILESLPQLAFPYINNPLRIANFLYNSLQNDDNNVVINSLNCLFELILYHNLTDQIDLVTVNNRGYNNIGNASGNNSENDNNFNNKEEKKEKENKDSRDKDNNNDFDWFYQKLYSLVDFEYLSSNSNIVLTLLIEKALNSSMLPNNLVSSFVKKLLSVSTMVETNICNCLLIISLNLLQKHYHHLLFLIHLPISVNDNDHYSTDYDKKNEYSVYNSNNRDDQNNNKNDEFYNNRNKGKYNNINGEGVETHTSLPIQEQQFLHELYLLLNHFNYDTVKIIGVFFTDLKLRNKINFSLRDFLYSDDLDKLLEKSKNSVSNVFKSTVQNSTTLTKSFFV